MIRKKIANSSIITKLLFSTISVLAVMMIFSNILIDKKQIQLSNEIEEQIESSIIQSEKYDNITLIVNEAQIRSLAEYHIFVAFTIGGCIAAGGIIISLIIVKILKPLKNLTQTINKVDINNLTETQNNIRLDEGSYEIRKLSAAFENALNKISEGYEKQRQFNTNVSHELRTPLAVLLTKIDVYKKCSECIDADTAQFIDTMEKSIIRLAKLVEDILFISRDYEVKKKQVSLNEIAEEVVLDLEDKAEKKGIKIDISGDEITLYTDDILLERSLYNLVDNAVKYTQAGGFCSIELQKNPECTRIFIKDNGQGISEQDKENIFDLFYRVESSRNRETGGYGVGLALVRDAVNRIGGTISVRDNKPAGSIFEINIPTS